MQDALAEPLDRFGPIWIKDPDGRYLAIGQALADWIGTPRAMMLGRHDEEFWPGTAVRRFRVDDHAALASGRGVVIPEHRAGAPQPFVTTVKLPLYAINGDLVGALGFFDQVSPDRWPHQIEAMYEACLAVLGPALDGLRLRGHRAGLEPAFRERTALASPTLPAWLEDARAQLVAGFRRRVRVADLAHGLGVHPSHLGRAFRDAFGIGVHGYLRRLRVEWACVELRSTMRPAGEIGFAAGFSDQSHFTREFRRVVGVPPGRYRIDSGPEPEGGV